MHPSYPFRRLAAALCAPLLVGLAACGQHVGPQAHAGTPQAIVEPALATVEVALPADFPRDVWLPASHRLTTAIPVGEGLLVNLNASGELAALVADCESEMTRHAWSSNMRFQSDNDVMLGYEKDGRSVVVTLTIDTSGDAFVSMQVKPG